MRWGAFGLAVAAALSATAPAFACKGKNVLFRDNFAATDPGWGLYDKNAVKIGAGSLKLAPQPKHYAFIYYRGDAYQQADACVDVTVGAGSGVPDGDAGLVFAFEDYVGFYYFWISPKNGTAGVLQWSDAAGKYLVPMAPQKVQGLGTRVGDKNTLRVAIDGTRATAYLNDRLIVQLTIKAPKEGGFFGLGAARVDDAPATWTFGNFTITDLP
jgi:hypothetical protein